MMRIGFDAKRVFHNRSGLGNYSRDILRMLAVHFPENEYLLYNPKKGNIEFNTGENSSIIYPAGFWGKSFSSVWRRKWITTQLKEDKLDLFHGLSNELPSGISNTNIPSLVSIHDLIFYKYPQWYRAADRIIHQKKVKQAAIDATHILAISEQTKKDILEYLPVSEEKISVIYQGCHPAFKQVYSAPEMESVKLKFNLPEKFLLSVGTIEPRKNLLTTVKSLLHHSLPLVVVGKKTVYYKEVDAFIKKHNLQNRFLYLQGVTMTELAMIYRMAFVFCYPSIYEGFGIPVIESLFSGTPVITNKDGCFAEAGGPDSFYIDCFDDKQISDIIVQLTQNNELYTNVSEKGIQYAQRFNDDKIANSLMHLYQQFAKKKQ